MCLLSNLLVLNSLTLRQRMRVMVVVAGISAIEISLRNEHRHIL